MLSAFLFVVLLTIVWLPAQMASREGLEPFFSRLKMTHSIPSACSMGKSRTFYTNFQTRSRRPRPARANRTANTGRQAHSACPPVCRCVLYICNKTISASLDTYNRTRSCQLQRYRVLRAIVVERSIADCSPGAMATQYGCSRTAHDYSSSQRHDG